ncbi:hypothetical protein [Pseudoduganella namucuonensis]|uniref:hypothetical protein n=1 Tax=Pseudoduganella namucuonensis TaxID=1035707 RepID=UPI001160BD09|nr:hypothetical protein [Pseudoduganella namucuonensis]
MGEIYARAEKDIRDQICQQSNDRDTRARRFGSIKPMRPVQRGAQRAGLRNIFSTHQPLFFLNEAMHTPDSQTGTLMQYFQEKYQRIPEFP